MKNLKLWSLLILGGLLMVSCGDKPTTSPPTDDGEEPIVEAPSIIIPIQDAEDMYHRYGTDRAALVERTINVDEQGNPIPEDDERYVQATRSLSIDYDTLKQYLAFIEQEAGDAKTDISGLRIYFSQYAKGKNDGRATVFLNPLMKNGGSSINDDVAFAIKTEDGKSTAVPVGKLVKVPVSNSNRADLTMPIQGGIQSLAGNRFPWNPPPETDPDDFQ